MISDFLSTVIFHWILIIKQFFHRTYNNYSTAIWLCLVFFLVKLCYCHCSEFFGHCYTLSVFSFSILFRFHSIGHLVLSKILISNLESNIEINIVHAHDTCEKAMIFIFIGLKFALVCLPIDFAWHDRFHENWADHLIIHLGLSVDAFLYSSRFYLFYALSLPLLLAHSLFCIPSEVAVGLLMNRDILSECQLLVRSISNPFIEPTLTEFSNSLPFHMHNVIS